MKKLSLFVFFFAAFAMALPQESEANRMRRWATKLGLSETQKNQIQQIIYKARRAQISIRAKLQLARLDLQQLLKKHKPVEANVVTAIEKAAKFELALKKSRILMMVRIKSVLTAKQAKKLSKINAKRRARRRARRMRYRRWMRNRRWRRRQGGGGGGR